MTISLKDQLIVLEKRFTNLIEEQRVLKEQQKRIHSDLVRLRDIIINLRENKELLFSIEEELNDRNS